MKKLITILVFAAGMAAVLAAVPSPLYVGRFVGDGAGLTNLNMRVSTQIKLGHVGRMTGINHHNDGTPYALYLGAGQQGVIRQFEITADNARWKTNLSIRIYADAGNLSGAQFIIPPTNSLVFDLPLDAALGERYTDPADNSVNWVNTRYVRGVRSTAFVTLSLNYPCPFTNGILIGLYTNAPLLGAGGQSPKTNDFYSYVGYELGSVPSNYSNYRLRTARVVGESASHTGTVLAWPAAGEALSVFAAYYDLNAGGGYFEGEWSIVSDGQGAGNINSKNLVSGTFNSFANAGGEDIFNSGYYLASGTNRSYDFGTTHHYTSGNASANEAYRHWDYDTTVWDTNALIRQHGLPDTDSSTVLVYLGAYPDQPSGTADTDATAYLTAIGNDGSGTTSNSIVRLVLNAKRHGWWVKCDSIYPFRGAAATPASKDLKGAHNITWHGTTSGRFSASGITGNGTDFYGDTGFNPATASGALYTLNSAHLSVYNATASLADYSIYIGCEDGVKHAFLGNDDAGDVYVDGLNSNTGTSFYNRTKVNGTGYFAGLDLATRLNSRAEVLYSHIASWVNTNLASASLPSQNIYVMGRNADGSADHLPAANFRFATFGGAITDFDYLYMRCDIEQFLKDEGIELMTMERLPYGGRTGVP